MRINYTILKQTLPDGKEGSLSLFRRDIFSSSLIKTFKIRECEPAENEEREKQKVELN